MIATDSWAARVVGWSGGWQTASMSLEGVLDRLDVRRAVETELGTRNRLMPPRWDRIALATQPDEVAEWLRPQYLHGQYGELADVVFVEKSRSGVRPISEFSLVDRVLYRALVSLISESLPPHLVDRSSIADFYAAPLAVDSTEYVSKTDVTAYYEFVDHDLLQMELLAQTGEAPAIQALIELLGRVMGRRMGLPQIHKSSDILGDTYIDPVRRRMRRAGLEVFTYSDDFRIASRTLASARSALESCATEVRRLGLVLNESKTFTYGVEKYRTSLTGFEDAERALFEDATGELAILHDDDYGDPDTDDVVEESPVEKAGFRLGDSESDAIAEAVDAIKPSISGPSLAIGDAARKAWQLWMADSESGDSQSHQETAVTQLLLGKALPVLGSIGELEPLDHLSWILRRDPAITPKVSRYMINLGATSPNARTSVRTALDSLVTEPSFSIWQQMWLAEAAGRVRLSEAERPLHAWLKSCVESGSAPIAATAAAAMGRLGLKEPELLARALDRVGPEWRDLVLWGLAMIDARGAETYEESKMDRLLIAATAAMAKP